MAENFDLKLYKGKMSKAHEAYLRDLSTLRTGRANSSMLDLIRVDVYGQKMPINQLATVSVPESRLITVQVWDDSLINSVENTIRNSNLGLNPMIEGNLIRIPIPELSEERRKEIAKIASKYSEDCKISIRNIRRDAMENIKGLEKNKEISQDDSFKYSGEVQEITDELIEKIDTLFSEKEKDILTV